MLSLFGSRRSCRLQSSICSVSISLTPLRTLCKSRHHQIWKLLTCFRSDRIFKILLVRRSDTYPSLDHIVFVESPCKPKQRSVCDKRRLQTCRLVDLQTCRLADLQTCRLADLQTCRLADRQTCRLAFPN